MPTIYQYIKVDVIRQHFEKKHLSHQHFERHIRILFVYELRQIGPERLMCKRKVPFSNVCNFVSKGRSFIFLTPNK